jgi:phosphate:Na+ symporter
MASKSDRKKNIGSIMIGFAVLMFGMETMIDAVQPLGESEVFANMMESFSNPIIGVLVGTVVTAIIQSSTASVGILQALCATGTISVGAALAIVMGQNIGTCLTTIISSIGASKNAQRAALFHVYFNVIGTIVFLIVVYLPDYFFQFDFMRQPAGIATVALLHTIHNVASTVLFLPFTKQMEKLMLWTIPKSEEEKKVFSYTRLDERFLNNTAYAVRLCKDVATDMMSEAKRGVNMALQALCEYNIKDADEIMMLEEVVDQYEDKIGTYLIKLSSHSMYEEDSQTCSALLHCIGDFERLSDHSVNLIESVQEMVDKKLKFVDRAQQEMIVYTNAISAIVEQTLTAFKYFDLNLAMTIEPFEEVIDKLTAKVKKRHYKRLANGKCSVEMGYILQDILTNCERIADHCSNIAIGLLQMEDLEQVAHRYQENLSANAKKIFAETYQAYLKKYELPDK